MKINHAGEKWAYDEQQSTSPNSDGGLIFQEARHGR